MIIDVKKYLIVGLQKDLDLFFAQAQQEGFIEFIPGAKKPQKAFSARAETLLSAMRILKKYPPMSAVAAQESMLDEMAENIVSMQSSIDQLSSDARRLEVEIARVAPFGDFSQEDIHYIEKNGRRVIQFFCRAISKAEDRPLPEHVLYINTEYDLDYFIGISAKKERYPDMMEMYIEVPLSRLRQELVCVREKLKILEEDVKNCVPYLSALHKRWLDELDAHHLDCARKGVSLPLDHALFSIEAWIPKTKLVDFHAMTEKMAVYAEPIAIDPGQATPTYMENHGCGHMGEDLVNIYDVPSTTDKDPSSWVFWSFALFFSMIIADAGYGFIFLAIALLLKRKFPNVKGNAKRMLDLGVWLSSGCIVWGVLIGSYFAMPLSKESFLSKISLLQFVTEKRALYEGLNTVSKNTILLEFSLLVGVVHVSLSLLRYARRNLAGIGWVVFLIGAYLYFPTALKATTFVQFLGGINTDVAATYGLQMIYIGMGLAVSLALLQKRFQGISEITQVVQVFADVLSYLRLYALALASTIMAETFNDLGKEMGFAVGALVIFLGHSVNILIATMGGVIHGLRLNFVEWYRYSFYGGGLLFRPLKKINF